MDDAARREDERAALVEVVQVGALVALEGERVVERRERSRSSFAGGSRAKVLAS